MRQGRHRRRRIANECALCWSATTKTVEHYRQQQEQAADDFNLLEVMNLTGKEIRHSMVLAWLLDHDLAKLGTHAQGKPLVFGLVPSASSTSSDLPIGYADCTYWARREVVGDESIVDCRGLRAGVDSSSTSRTRFGLARATIKPTENGLICSAGLPKLKVSAGDVHAFFLTPDGKKPRNVNFTPFGGAHRARAGGVCRSGETFRT